MVLKFEQWGKRQSGGSTSCYSEAEYISRYPTHVLVRVSELCHVSRSLQSLTGNWTQRRIGKDQEAESRESTVIRRKY